MHDVRQFVLLVMLDQCFEADGLQYLPWGLFVYFQSQRISGLLASASVLYSLTAPITALRYFLVPSSWTSYQRKTPTVSPVRLRFSFCKLPFWCRARLISNSFPLAGTLGLITG